jgi:hypothetical protein
MRIVRIHIMPTRATPTPLRHAGSSGPPDKHTGKTEIREKFFELKSIFELDKLIENII